jgi:hypothetical protein
MSSYTVAFQNENNNKLLALPVPIEKVTRKLAFMILEITT